MQLTKFVLRQFSTKFSGTKILLEPSLFEKEINDRKPVKITQGYALFCHLYFFENWMHDVRSGTVKITRANEKNLKSAYMSRVESELPVLTRWFEGIVAPVAKYIVLVLYDKKQLQEENPCEVIDAKHGVVAILGQMDDFEEPMQPITMMRNALGIKEGGSGVSIDRKKYTESIDFWSKHAVVK